MSDLKTSIVTSHNVGDEYIQQAEKYVPLENFVLDYNFYKVLKIDDKNEVFNIEFYKETKLIQTRRCIIKNNKLHISRNLVKNKRRLYNIFLQVKLFG